MRTAENKSKLPNPHDEEWIVKADPLKWHNFAASISIAVLSVLLSGAIAVADHIRSDPIFRGTEVGFAPLVAMVVFLLIGATILAYSEAKGPKREAQRLNQVVQRQWERSVLVPYLEEKHGVRIPFSLGVLSGKFPVRANDESYSCFAMVAGVTRSKERDRKTRLYNYTLSDVIYLVKVVDDQPQEALPVVVDM